MIRTHLWIILWLKYMSWNCVTCDFLGPFSRTKSRKNILVNEAHSYLVNFKKSLPNVSYVKNIIICLKRGSFQISSDDHFFSLSPRNFHCIMLHCEWICGIIFCFTCVFWIRVFWICSSLTLISHHISLIYIRLCLPPAKRYF